MQPYSTFRYGMKAGCLAFKSGDFATVSRFVADSNSKDPTTQSRGLEALLGLAVALSEGLRVLAKRGSLKLTGHPLPTADDLIYSVNIAGRKLFSRQVQVVLNASVMARARVRSEDVNLTIDESEGEQEKAPQPVPVVVTSMPARRTTTHMQYNSVTGEIESADQIERDAFALAPT